MHASSSAGAGRARTVRLRRSSVAGVDRRI
jgi:hypothetical protein